MNGFVTPKHASLRQGIYLVAIWERPAAWANGLSDNRPRPTRLEWAATPVLDTYFPAHTPTAAGGIEPPLRPRPLWFITVSPAHQRIAHGSFNRHACAGGAPTGMNVTDCPIAQLAQLTSCVGFTRKPGSVPPPVDSSLGISATQDRHATNTPAQCASPNRPVVHDLPMLDPHPPLTAVATATIRWSRCSPLWQVAPEQNPTIRDQ